MVQEDIEKDEYRLVTINVAWDGRGGRFHRHRSS